MLIRPKLEIVFTSAGSNFNFRSGSFFARWAWHFWITDASGSSGLRAAKIDDPRENLKWQSVPAKGIDAGHAVCRIIGGRSGLVILASDGIAAAAVRGLSGLVSGLTCFPASDPLAQPITKSFASYGVFAVT